MRIDEKTYAAMPASLKAIFAKAPNPGSDEVRAGFPVTGAAKSGVRAPNGSMGYHGGASGLPGAVSGYDDNGGSAARFFYCPKTSKKERGADNNHPTVKPIDLMAYLCRLVTPPGGVVLDPFMGSGSTGLAALREGFRFVGIEREATYMAIAQARLHSVLSDELAAEFV